MKAPDVGQAYSSNVGENGGRGSARENLEGERGEKKIKDHLNL